MWKSFRRDITPGSIERSIESLWDASNLHPFHLKVHNITHCISAYLSWSKVIIDAAVYSEHIQVIRHGIWPGSVERSIDL
jgi:hypothetical protein